METLIKHADIIALALGVASLVLHFVAPRTKNTVDDKLADGIDKAKEWVEGQKPKA